MLEVYDLNLKKQAILQNAFDINEEIVKNNISHLRFSLPYNDEKIKYCKPFHFVRFGKNLYRILPSNYDWNNTPTIEFECEHVIATLIDELMYGDFVVGNLGVYTSDVINFVLNKQKKKNWVLGVCEFSRQFEYGWSHESLLSALFSIPNCFVEPFIWEFDTSSYPWVVSLKKLDVDAVPSLYVRKGKNMISLKRSSDPTNICTRLYAHGYGEGINTLTFADINNGKPYIDSPQEYIDKYGYKTRLWVDRRYENKESLLQAARAMLDELQEPLYEYEVEFTEVDKSFYNKAEVGRIVKLITDDVDYKTYITEVSWEYTMSGVNCKITIANKPKDIASSVADLADRQRIEMTYAQGATQLYAQSLQANCDSKSGAEMQFYIPEEMRIVNSVKAKIKVDRFRAYSKATDTKDSEEQTSSNGGKTTRTSSSGGGGTSTSSSGGGSTDTSRSGGGSTETSEGGGGTTTDTGPGGINVKYDWYWTQTTENHAHEYRDVVSHQHEITLRDHTHDVRIPSHRHEFDIPDHDHRVSFPSHTHSVEIPDHNHKVTIPSHNHEITPGIYRFGNPNRFFLYVDGIIRKSFSSLSEEIDITEYLIDSSSGIIRRGVWHSISVLPNDLSYVFIDMYVQGFVQSRGDNTV